MKLVITVGLPGSGKTTYLRKLRVNAISSDDVRRIIADDPADQSMNARIFATIRYLIRQRIAAGRPVTYVDATHLMRWERRPYIELAERYGCTLEALYFDVPLEVCLKRNRGRKRIVPAAAIEKMASRLQPPTKAEGFSRIVRLPARKLAVQR